MRGGGAILDMSPFGLKGGPFTLGRAPHAVVLVGRPWQAGG